MFAKKGKKGFVAVTITIGLVIVIAISILLLLLAIGVLSYGFTFILPRLIGIFMLVGSVILAWRLPKIRGNMKKISFVIFIVLIIVGLLLTLFPDIINTMNASMLKII